MQLNDYTMDILKNFSSINPSIVIKPGTTLSTISPQKTIMAIVSGSDDFSSEAGIYDLSRFLATVSMFESPELNFDEKSINIMENKRKVQYTLADTSMILQPPEKEITMPPCEVNVDISWNDLQSVLKAASVLGLPEIAFAGIDGEIVLEAVNSKNPTTDRYGVTVGSTSDTFNMYMKVENLKLMPNDYTVNLSSKGLSCFVSDNVKYFIAIESNSTFGE
jgi:hypothetical protein|tara:strand:+ start:1297 stop:1956 length:660 start_codon:yes stop_codon:yes gene_type:complete